MLMSPNRMIQEKLVLADIMFLPFLMFDLGPYWLSILTFRISSMTTVRIIRQTDETPPRDLTHPIRTLTGTETKHYVSSLYNKINNC
jgi:hypothetical protein